MNTNSNPYEAWRGRDYLFIERLKLKGFVGVTERELRKRQVVLVDVRLYLARSTEGVGDDLGRTIDYMYVAQKLQARFDEGRRHLLERLAFELAEVCLGMGDVSAVRLRVRKPSVFRGRAMPGCCVFRQKPEA